MRMITKLLYSVKAECIRMNGAMQLLLTPCYFVPAITLLWFNTMRCPLSLPPSLYKIALRYMLFNIVGHKIDGNHNYVLGITGQKKRRGTVCGPSFPGGALFPTPWDRLRRFCLCCRGGGGKMSQICLKCP